MLRTIRAALVVALTAAGILTAATPAQARLPEIRDSRIVAASQVAAVKRVTVVPDDSSWALAARYCGRGELYRSMTVTSPRGLRRGLARIWPGDVATIPCAQAGMPATAAPRRAVAAPTGGWVHPLPGARCVSGWGAPRRGHTHKGVDLPRPSGTPIRAAHAGRVTAVTWDNGAGWYVMLTHPGNVHTVYMHMRAPSPLRVGTAVQAGQTIGYVGSTGDSSGPHLHFEVHVGGKWAGHQVNPSPWMRSRGVRVGC